MLRTPIREVEHKRSIDLKIILIGLAIFCMALTLLSSKVKLYELRQERQELEDKLEEQQESLDALQREAAELPDLYQRAKALGLQEIDPDTVEILHIRGQMTD